MSGRESFRKIKPILKICVICFSILPRRVSVFLLNVFSSMRGKFGMLLRYILVKNLSKSCGDNVSIAHNVELKNLNNISFGDNVSIHTNCYFDGFGGLSIGNDVSFAHNCSILTANHDWSDTSKPIKYNDVRASPVSIQDDVWLGCGVRVLAGISIDSRSIVAAGSVVTKNVESNTVVAGVPSKVLKHIS